MSTLNDKTHFSTIEKPAVAEFKDRGSKFIAYAYPISSVDDFKRCLQELKTEHPKAVHHCFAYRLGLDGNEFRSSDDGEPSGTAGKPILGQIDSKGVTDTAIIVVRYFGGTLLGVPGLINAYKTAAALVLQVVPIVQKQVTMKYNIQFDYTNMNEVMTLLKQFQCEVLEKEMQLFCRVTAAIPVARLTEVLHHFNDLHQVELQRLK